MVMEPGRFSWRRNSTGLMLLPRSIKHLSWVLVTCNSARNGTWRNPLTGKLTGWSSSWWRRPQVVSSGSQKWLFKAMPCWLNQWTQLSRSRPIGWRCHKTVTLYFPSSFAFPLGVIRDSCVFCVFTLRWMLIILLMYLKLAGPGVTYAGWSFTSSSPFCLSHTLGRTAAP